MKNVLGKVVQWNDAKGFGFIQPHDGSAQIFFHAREFGSSDSTRPQAGDWVRFERGKDHKGRIAAVAVRPALARHGHTATHPKPRNTQDGMLPLLGWLFLFYCLAGTVYLTRSGDFSHMFLLYLGALNLVTWVIYAVDKYAAKHQYRRIPEKTLHTLELAGGWPGGFVAQRMLRHKNRNRSYQFKFWIIAIVHTATVSAWAMGLLRIPH